MKSISLFFLVLGAIVKAQVGIGTINPLQQLHVSGTVSSTDISGTNLKLVEPTARIDGLEFDSGAGNDFLRSLSVNQNGDLVTSIAVPKMLIMYDNTGINVNGTDYISQTNLTSTASSGPVEQLLGSYSFSLTEKSIVQFMSNTSVKLYASGTTIITDGGAKSYGTFYRFTAAPSGYVNHNFGNSTESYSNRVNNVNAAGPFYIPSAESIVLPAGNYTVGVYAYINGGTGSSANFVAQFGTENNDSFSVVSYPIH